MSTCKERNRIEESVTQAVRRLLEPKLELLHWHEFKLERNDDGGKAKLTVRCQETEEIHSPATVLKVLFLHSDSQLQLTNILMPDALRWQRLGKRTIKSIFDAAHAAGYQLFLMDTVPGFHARLLKRHAQQIDEDTLLITPETNLEGDVGSPRMGCEHSDPSEVRGYSILDVLDQLDAAGPPKLKS
jgi:hypothetical protein